jgi:two-component system response regulator HydG
MLNKVPRLLILEDDIAFGVMLAIQLEKEGFEVSRHTTATSALDHIAENRADLIIADLLIKIDGQLVQDGGVRLISQLRQIQEYPAPIIAMSSMFQSNFGATEAITTAKTVGATAVLPKPFETTDLLALIHKLI